MWQRILLACLVLVFATQTADAWRGRGRRFVRQAAPSSQSQTRDTEQPETDRQGPQFLGGRIYKRVEPQEPAWLDLDVEEQENAMSVPFELQAPNEFGLAHLLELDPAEMPFAPFEKKAYLPNVDRWKPFRGGSLSCWCLEPSESEIEFLKALLDIPLDLENSEIIELLDPLGIDAQAEKKQDTSHSTEQLFNFFMSMAG